MSQLADPLVQARAEINALITERTLLKARIRASHRTGLTKGIVTGLVLGVIGAFIFCLYR